MTTDLNHALIAAAWQNDFAAATRLIDAGADVNFRDETVQSAFLIATSEGYHDLLLLTLAHSADVQAKDSYNGTGLIRAADRGHAQIIATLLRAGTEVDHINRLGWTALHEAIILGNGDARYQDCVRLLLAGGADPKLPSQQDMTSPLRHAESRGFATIAATLRAVINAPDPAEPNATLREAVEGGDADQMVIALRAGADLSTLEGMGSTSGAPDDRHRAAHRLLALLTPPAEAQRG